MKWIKCSDKLPDEGREVLTYGSHGIKIDFLVNTEGSEPYIWACRLCDEWETVNYWMGLPSIPEEEEDRGKEIGVKITPTTLKFKTKTGDLVKFKGFKTEEVKKTKGEDE